MREDNASVRSAAQTEKKTHNRTPPVGLVGSGLLRGGFKELDDYMRIWVLKMRYATSHSHTMRTSHGKHFMPPMGPQQLGP